MARFDYYPAPSGKGYVVDVQSELMDHLNTRLVVPLLPLSHAPPLQQRLNLMFEINGVRYVFLTQFLTVMPIMGPADNPEAGLGLAEGNLGDNAAAITNALDMMLHGF